MHFYVDKVVFIWYSYFAIQKAKVPRACYDALVALSNWGRYKGLVSELTPYGVRL